MNIFWIFCRWLAPVFMFSIASLAEAIEVKTIDDIKLLLNDKSKNIRTISDLLPQLSSTYRSNFSLMMRSRSAQDASIENPRVILFGEDARLMMAFNGDPTQKNYDKLELIQFRDQTARFEFFEIQFPELDGFGKPLNALTRPVVSAADPAKCLKCHTGDPRPIWGNIQNWHGAFMNTSTFAIPDAPPGTPEFEVRPEVGLPNIAEYKAVLENKFSVHPRYKALENLIAPYLDPSYGQDTPAKFYHERDLHRRIATLNAKRVVRILKTDSFYDNYKFAILGNLVGGTCRKLVPESGSTSGPTVNYVSILDTLPEDYPSQRINNTFWGPNLEIPFTFRKLFRDYLGTELNFGQNVNDNYVAPYMESASYRNGFLEQMSVGDSAIGVLLRKFPSGSVEVEASCEELKKLSLAALANAPFPTDEVAQRESRYPKALKECMSCHTTTPIKGPIIVFDNSILLGDHLKKEGYPRGTFLDEIKYRVSADAPPTDSMPPTHGLTEVDRRDLLDYLNRVSSNRSP